MHLAIAINKINSLIVRCLVINSQTVANWPGKNTIAEYMNTKKTKQTIVLNTFTSNGSKT